MQYRKTKTKLIDVLTAKHYELIAEIDERFKDRLKNFHREVFFTVKEMHPELLLEDIKASHEEVGQSLVDLYKGRVIDKVSNNNNNNDI
jgi:hypothetical protein